MAIAAAKVEDMRIDMNEVESSFIDHRVRPYTAPRGLPDLTDMCDKMFADLEEFKCVCQSVQEACEDLKRKVEGVDEKLTLVVEKIQKDMIEKEAKIDAFIEKFETDLEEISVKFGRHVVQFAEVDKKNSKQFERIRASFEDFKNEIDEDYKETNNKLANLVRQYTNLTADQKKTSRDLGKELKELEELVFLRSKNRHRQLKHKRSVNSQQYLKTLMRKPPNWSTKE